MLQKVIVWFKNSKLTRCYYQMMRQLVREHNTIKTRLIFLLDFGIFIFSHRYLYLLSDFLQNGSDPAKLVESNPVMLYLLVDPDSKNPFILLVFYLFEVFNFYCAAALMRLNVGNITWNWWYQLVVENQDQYHDALYQGARQKELLLRQKRYSVYQIRNPQSRTQAGLVRFVPEFLLNPLTDTLAKYRLWSRLENVNQEQLLSQNLSIMPRLSRPLRSRLFLFLTVTDKCCAALQILFSLVFIFGELRYAIQYGLFQQTFLVMLGICAEVFMVGYCLLSIGRFALFFVITSVLGSVVYPGHVLDENRRFRLQMKQLTLSGLRRQLSEHNWVCYLVMRGSQELFGSVLFMFLLTNIPINVYLLYQLIFNHHLRPFDQLAYGILFSLQFLAMIVVIGPLAWCQTVYHSPQQFIPRLQLQMSGDFAFRRKAFLSYKLKYDDLYGRLLNGQKIALAIGPVKSITYLSVVEFIFFYIGFMLMAFKRLSKL